jgi:hypothetical protein
VTGDDFAPTAAEPFRSCRPLETQSDDHCCGHLEHLPALHETVHSSEKSDRVSDSLPQVAKTISAVSVAVLLA